MKLSEVFDQLVYGELSQLKIAENGEIDTEDYPRIVSIINTGLTALFTRFPLKTTHLKIRLIEGVTHYPLLAKHADSVKSPGNPLKYIVDENHPFKEDILKIAKVTTDSGVELRINDSSDPMSVKNPSINTLVVPAKLVEEDKVKIPDRYRTEYLHVEYRANHPKITVGLGYFDPARIDLELPHSHLQALLFYVASRAHSPVGLAEEGLVGSGYFAKYDNECRLLEAYNANIDTQTTTLLPKYKGFI